jgi:hypothetical protein
MTDQEFVAAFEAGTIPDGEFHHRDHLRLAWIYLQKEPPETAISRFVTELRGFVKKKGAAGKYHETITWAYLLLINERLARGGREAPWPDFCAENPDLFHWNPSILESYYRPETLASEVARKVFVLPDCVG